jgi:hypothetical protein
MLLKFYTLVYRCEFHYCIKQLIIFLIHYGSCARSIMDQENDQMLITDSLLSKKRRKREECLSTCALLSASESLSKFIQNSKLWTLIKSRPEIPICRHINIHASALHSKNKRSHCLRLHRIENIHHLSHGTAPLQFSALSTCIQQGASYVYMISL